MDILKTLGESEVLAQLAEECSELGQAALKLRRALDGKNPTPKTVAECTAAMDEEIADVRLCLETLGFHSNEHTNIQTNIEQEKRLRWQNRLQVSHSEDNTEFTPGMPVWVIERDSCGDPADWSGYLFVAHVAGYVIVSSYVNDYDFQETIEYHAESTQECFDTTLEVYPDSDCYMSKEDCMAAFERSTQ